MKAFLNGWVRPLLFSACMTATMFSDGWHAIAFGFLTVLPFGWSKAVWWDRGWNAHARFHNEMALDREQ